MRTDNEIIKALEICTSEHLGCEDGCPYRMGDCLDDGYRSVPMKDALDLINQQKAEIERLKARNDELNALNKTTTIEAIKEFDKEFTKELYMLQGFGDLVNAKKVRKLKDNLVKEMTEQKE